jgi:hypothetical protein
MNQQLNDMKEAAIKTAVNHQEVLKIEQML